MKTNKLITVLGFTLLVGSIAYSMQQLTLERKTQEQIKVSFNKQAIEIKNLQKEIKTVTEQTKKLESSLATNQQDNKIVLTTNDENKTKNNSGITLLSKQLLRLTLTVKKQEKELKALQNFTVSISKERSSNTVATVENTPKTLKERETKAKAQTEKIAQDMENHWQQQAVETVWSQTIEKTARTSMTEETGLILHDISCKTDVCRLEITTTGESKVDPSDWVMDHIKTSEVNSQSKMNADGSESFVIYLSKQGASLSPNIN